MFYNCSGLTSLNVSNFNTAVVGDMSGMFDGCNGLTSLDLFSFDMGNVTNTDVMLENTVGLTEIIVPKNIINSIYLPIDKTWYWYGNGSVVESLEQGHSSTDTLQTKVLDHELPSAEFPTDWRNDFDNLFSSDQIVGDDNIGIDPMTTNDIVSIRFDNLTTIAASGEYYIDTGLTLNGFSIYIRGDSQYYISFVYDSIAAPGVCDDLFSSLSSLTTIKFYCFNTINVTSMNRMFAGCTNLTTIDFASFDTTSVSSMEGMFDGCSSLTTLDLYRFDMISVYNGDYMFDGCNALSRVILPRNISNPIGLPADKTWYWYGDGSEVTEINDSYQSTENIKMMITDQPLATAEFSSSWESEFQELTSTNVQDIVYIRFDGILTYKALDDYNYVGEMEIGIRIYVKKDDQYSFSFAYDWITAPQDCHNLFAGLYHLQCIEFYNFDMSAVQSTSGMFDSCDLYQIVAPNMIGCSIALNDSMTTPDGTNVDVIDSGVAGMKLKRY